MEEKLHERIIGQEAAVASIAEALRRLRTGVQLATRPISFLFLGPTGVGKTETAKALGELYFGGESNIIRLDMSEYANEVGLTRLLGALPGQGDERGELTDKIHDHPASLVLLDEFEKAHPRILDLFLQVLEDGRLTDNKGKTVSFSNAIIIATSNAGSEFIRESVKSGKPVDKEFEASLIENLQSNRIFKPELLNRFDDVVTFKPLSKENVQAIIKLELKKLIKALEEEDISVSFDDTVIAKIAEEGIDDQFGARPLRRYIQNTVEDLIAKKKLKDEISRGSKVVISVGKDGSMLFQAT
jgi:ATP-dependent Clp protease ATP-binding subunit ClpA